MKPIRPVFCFVAMLCLTLLLMTGGRTVWAEEELIVSAAASLTNAFNDMGKKFESLNSGSKVICNFGASGALLQQIEQGAPVDIFVSADQKTMNQAQDKKLIVITTRVNFVSNQLVLIAPADSKLSLNSLNDLNQAEVTKISLGNLDSVPAGRYARETLTSAGLWDKLTPKFIYGASVRQVLDYVMRGEVDAGFVFATDAVVAKHKVRVAVKAEQHSPILYPVAIVGASPKKESAQKFVDFMMSPAGREILSKYGFGKP
ncbi:MAG: molybdate ABC transporter substrate-binding protein [Deltaproteobacteria bacterium]|nr:molybdate ABC transporter substrate-binding protein [Deltaproteobacteria bacterium]